MANSKSCSRKFVANSWVYLIIVTFILSNLFIIFLSSDQSWQKFLICDFLQKADHIIASCLKNFLVTHGGVYLKKNFGQSVMLPDKNCVIRCQNNILIDSNIPCLKQVKPVVFHSGKQIKMISYHLAFLKFSQPFLCLFIRTINLTSI